MLLKLLSSQIPQLVDSLRVIKPLVCPIVKLSHWDIVSSRVRKRSATCGAEERVQGRLEGSGGRADRHCDFTHGSENSAGVVRLETGLDDAWVDGVGRHAEGLITVCDGSGRDDISLLAVAISFPSTG